MELRNEVLPDAKPPAITTFMGAVLGLGPVDLGAEQMRRMRSRTALASQLVGLLLDMVYCFESWPKQLWLDVVTNIAKYWEKGEVSWGKVLGRKRCH